MGTILLKAAFTAVLVVLISETAKRSTWWAAVLASLPLTSILAFCWLYYDTGDNMRVAALSRSILWLVLPSLLLFVALPWLLERQMPFGWALLIACALTALAYGGMLWALPRLGVELG